MTLPWFVPRSIRRAVSLLRTHSRNQIENRKLRAEHAAELSARHIAQLSVLTDRSELLRRMPKGLVCVEVGVAEGDFSREILDVMKPARLHLIDLWHQDSERYAESMKPALQRVGPEYESGVVQIHRGYSWDMLATLEDASLDWIYIDASHAYQHVRKDLLAALPKLKPDAWICGHDYARWSSQGVHRWGVVEAVNEFCLQHDWQLKYLTNESHRHLSYALTRLSGDSE